MKKRLSSITVGKSSETADGNAHDQDPAAKLHYYLLSDKELRKIWDAVVGIIDKKGI